MTDWQSGAVVASYNYTAFGDDAGSAGNAGLYNTHGYAGEQHDATGLSYNRARYYNSGIGRFEARDSYPSQNRYTYAGNNLVSYTDPTGNKSDDGSLIENAIFLHYLANEGRGHIVVRPNFFPVPRLGLLQNEIDIVDVTLHTFWEIKPEGKMQKGRQQMERDVIWFKDLPKVGSFAGDPDPTRPWTAGTIYTGGQFFYRSPENKKLYQLTHAKSVHDGVIEYKQIEKSTKEECAGEEISADVSVKTLEFFKSDEQKKAANPNGILNPDGSYNPGHVGSDTSPVNPAPDNSPNLYGGNNNWNGRGGYNNNGYGYRSGFGNFDFNLGSLRVPSFVSGIGFEFGHGGGIGAPFAVAP